jgi:hypothetical protein
MLFSKLSGSGQGVDSIHTETRTVKLCHIV